MIRKGFTALGQIAFFVIGTDKAMKRFVESIDFDAPCRRYPITPDPYSPEERAKRAAAKRARKPYRRPLWLKAEKRLDAWLRNR